MNDTAYLDIKGNIQIYKNDEKIFDDHNEVAPEALEVILNALTCNKGNYGIDIIKAKGIFPTVDKVITETSINLNTKTISFSTVLLEDDFNGYINQLYLHSSSIDKSFSFKRGLNILKDNSTRLKVIWNITINKV